MGVEILRILVSLLCGDKHGVICSAYWNTDDLFVRYTRIENNNKYLKYEFRPKWVMYMRGKFLNALDRLLCVENVCNIHVLDTTRQP